MLRWWKCKIISNDEGLFEFNKGDIVFAKNGEDMMTLFDGKKVAILPKLAVKKIKLLSWLGKNETAIVERDYQLKLKRTFQSSTADDPNRGVGQDPRELGQSGINEGFAESLDIMDQTTALQILNAQ